SGDAAVASIFNGAMAGVVAHPHGDDRAAARQDDAGISPAHRVAGHPSHRRVISTFQPVLKPAKQTTVWWFGTDGRDADGGKTQGPRLALHALCKGLTHGNERFVVRLRLI